MRFHLRSLLLAIALIAAFLGGRATVQPLIKEYEQQKVLLEKDVKSLQQLRPALSSSRELLKHVMEGLQQDRERLEHLRRQSKWKEMGQNSEKDAKLAPLTNPDQEESTERLGRRLVFPVNTERAMLGDATSTVP